MASGGIYLLGVVLIFVALGGIFYYFNFAGTVSQVEAVKGFIEDAKCYPDGSCVTVLITDQPDNTINEDLGKEVTIEKTKIVNGTYVTEEEVIQVKKQDDIPQIRKDNPNGVVVQGYIIIHNSITGDPIKPYVYNVMVEIECDEELNTHEGYNYCNTDSIFGRVQTEDAGISDKGKVLGGYYLP